MATGCRLPGRILQQFADQFLQLVELLSVQSWHTRESQRPLLTVNHVFAFTVLLEGGSFAII